MVAHAAISETTPPVAPLEVVPALLHLATGYVTFNGLRPTYTAVELTRPLDTPTSTSPALLHIVNVYRIAGTFDNTYHPPVEGQLWPRGDMDAEQKAMYA